MENRIRELREARGWSQQQLADAANTTQAQIGRLEKGERRLTQDWMHRLAPQLGVQPAELIGEGGASQAQADEPPALNLSLLEAAIESALTLMRHAPLTVREVAEQAAAAYQKMAQASGKIDRPA